MILRILLLILFSFESFAADICNVCLDTPSPTSEMVTGKGGSSKGEERNDVQKLPKPIFTGDLFYVVDNAEKLPLPAGKGVFFELPDKKKHVIKIMGPSGKVWNKVAFDCAEYEHGTKVFFESYGFYGPGWKTNPLPKNPAKCRWHPDYTKNK